MNKVLTLIYVLFHLCTTIPENSTIEGKVTDLKGEPLLFSTVALYQNGVVVKGIETDMDGNYFLSGIKPGTYDMEASIVGYATQKQTGLIIKAGSNKVNFQLADEQPQLVIKEVLETKFIEDQAEYIVCITTESLKVDAKVVEKKAPPLPPPPVEEEVKAYKVPLVETDCTTSGSTTSDKIRKLPTKSVHAVAATSAGISGREGSDISVRGSRSEETVYFLDGVRVVAGTKDLKIPEEKGQAGLVTAGEWNDLNNWEKWAELLKKDEFKNMNTFWGVHTEHRYPVFVTNENYDPISGISVFLKNDKDSIIWSAITDIHGRAELFDISEYPSEKLVLHYHYGNTKNKMTLGKKSKEEGLNITIKAECRSTSKANIAFVVDATGSMSDEIAYLKSDLASVIENVESQNSNVAISYGSVFYQDKGDNYVTRAQDFTTDERQLISFIDQQNAGGGGDFPEAVDSALLHTLNLAWEDDAQVKLIFLILDAPPHLEHIERYKKAVIKAANMGIKIIPVTGSGINRETEFLMKFTSILTNGTYAFITNHSGIGGDHLAPVHNDYTVEKLNELMTRVINGYLYSTPCHQDDETNLRNELDSFYPNPASTVLNVTWQKENLTRLDILSNTGQVVITVKDPERNKAKINIQNLISGQYYLRMTYKDQLVTRSFIKIN